MCVGRETGTFIQFVTTVSVHFVSENHRVKGEDFLEREVSENFIFHEWIHILGTSAYPWSFLLPFMSSYFGFFSPH